MTKKELAQIVAATTAITEKQSQALIETCMDVILKNLKKGESIRLAGFGTFSVSERSACTGRNPATGAEIKIPAKKVVKFKASSNLLNKITKIQ